MGDCDNCCYICCALALITLVVLIFSSVSSLEMNEIGLDYSSITKTISPQPLTAGIHFLGIGHELIKFNKTQQTIEFSIDKNKQFGPIYSRTSDGLEVILEISFQYKLNFDELYLMYNKFQLRYEQIYREMAINVLSENSTQYTAYDFFVDRQTIGQNMQEVLFNHFKSNCHASIEFFQLRSVDLPDKFEESIQLSEVTRQSIQKAEAQKNKTLVELETLIKTASYQKNVTINLASGDGEAIMEQAKAKASSILFRQNATSSSLKNFKDKLKMNSQNFVRYLQSKVIRDFDGDLTINIKQKVDQDSKPAQTPVAPAKL